MSEPIFSVLTGKANLEQIDDGNYTWTGTGTVADPYVTTYVKTGTSIPAVRGNTPGNWTSTNRPAWQINTSGVFFYRISRLSSADQDSDHWLYKFSDGGSTWTLVAQFNYPISTSTTRSISVGAGDIIEQRGNGSSYQSDTWAENPTVWLE